MNTKYKYFGDLNSTYKLWDKNFIKRIAKFGIPLGISTIIMSLMEVIDKLFVGQASVLDGEVGGYALGATFTATWYYNFVVVGIMGIMSMSSVVATQYFGVKKFDKVEESVRLSFYVGGVIAIIGVVIAFNFSNQINNFLANTDGETLASQANIKYGADYIKVMSLGALTFLFQQHVINYYAWNEKTKIILWMAILSIALNALFNYLFMFTFGFGVLGNAISTIIVQTLSTIFLLIILWKSKWEGNFNPFKNLTNISKEVRVKVMERWMIFANHAAFTILMTSSQITISKVYVNGPTILGIVTPFQNFFWVAMNGVLATTATIVGKSLGQEKYEESYANSIRILIYALVVATIGSILFSALSPILPLVFAVGRDNAELAKQATLVIVIMSFTYILWIWSQGYGIALKTGGKIIQFSIATSGTMIIDLVIAITLASLQPDFDYWLIFMIWRSSRLIRVPVSYMFFRRQTWVTSLISEDDSEKEKIIK